MRGRGQRISQRTTKSAARRQESDNATRAVTHPASTTPVGSNLTALQALADASPEVRHLKRLQQAADRATAPIQGVFAADTTFGLEIEMQHRYVSPWNFGKNLPELPLTDGTLKGWKAGTDRGRGASLWHGTAESNPTLESTIIALAKKHNPEQWTAHEIRNAMFATKMSPKQMQLFLSEFAKHVSTA